MRSSSSGRRSAYQGLSRSTSVAIARSTIGGSTVLSAANIHAIARARALASSGSRPGMALGDVEHDRAGFEQGEIAFLIGRDLPERMKRAMRGLLHLRERHQADVVGLAHFLERPAHAHVARQAPAAIGRALEGGDGGVHRRAPCLPGSARHTNQSVWCQAMPASGRGREEAQPGAEAGAVVAEVDRGAVHPGDGGDEGEAEAGAGDAAARVEADEAAEGAGAVGLGDAGAAVADDEGGHRRRGRRR